MKFFTKKQNDDFFFVEDDMEFTLGKNTPSTPHSPDALTPEEVLGFKVSDSDRYDGSSALESLKKRLSNAAEQGELKEDSVKPQKSPEENSVPKPSNITSKEILNNVNEQTKKAPDKPSLMDRCSPYFVDEDGKETTLQQEPLYKLQSVADILKSDSEDTIKRLSEKYGINFEELIPDPVLPTVSKQTETQQNSGKTKNTEPDGEIKPVVISDLDAEAAKPSQPSATFTANTATVTFTPIAANTAEPHIAVTTKTLPIDLTGELVKLPDTVPEDSGNAVKLQENEFDEFVPNEEPATPKETAKLIRKLSKQQRNYFLTTSFSFFLTALLSFGKLPFVSGLLLEHTFVSMIICSSLLGIIILLNIDMFKSFTRLFRTSSKPDCCAALASLATVLYAVFGIMAGEIILDMLLLLGIILSFRALSAFQKASYMLSNLKVISSNQPKQAIKLISDPAITFAMAKDSVEGDTLIAAAQKTESITDYMKYSTFGSFFGGKLPIINAFSLLLAVITGIACAAYFDGAVNGFYAAAAVLCFSALPTLFFIDTLPLYSASKKLNRIGAMIAGKTGAEHIELANATVLSSCDLFPEGTVTLHQMKVLSENNLDDTLIRAASLTEYMNSTLAPIFKSIANSGNVAVLPDTDTVKYEERMGISGWVDNRLLFIGNRTLMEAHGIEVPSIEVDRRILRQGYFPVYVATQEKACALLMVQYSVNPKISRELRRLTGLGITLLVNNTDPNLSEEMICDYLGLYSDSVKVMSAAGCHMYKNSVTKAKSCSAPAAYRKNNLALASILNCATSIKRSNTILSVIYVICAILGAIIFAYTSFSGSGSLMSNTAILIYGIICTAVSYLLYLTERP